jgi:hypothetical protein
MASRTCWTPKKEAFLAALADGGSLARACQAARFSRSRAYEWRSDDSAFAADWDQALDDGTDLIEDALLRRVYPDQPSVLGGSGKCRADREI